MTHLFRPPSDEATIQSAPEVASCSQTTSWFVLTATILGSSMAFIDGTAVNVALPTLQADLNATIASVQWIVEAYALFLAALLLVGGFLGDKFGRKRVFAIGILLFSLASIGCGLSQNVNQLIIMRAIQGVGSALLVPGSLAIISANFSRQQRGRAIGTWSSFTAITASLGPVLGGWLVQNISWRGIFFINIPLAIAVLILLRSVPESRDEGIKGHLDWPGALLTTLGLGAIVYGLINETTLGLFHPLVLGSLGIGITMIVILPFAETHRQAPLLPMHLFRSRVFSGANLFTFLLYAGMGSVSFFLPFDLIQVQGYSVTAAGAAFLPLIVIMFLLSRWSGSLVDRYGATAPLIIGPLIAATGFVLFTLPTTGGSYWTTFFPATFVLGLGLAISVAPLTTTVMEAVESQHAGLASGINNTVSRIAVLLSIAVLSIVVLNVFTNNLNHYLNVPGLAPQIKELFDAQNTKLAGIVVPTNVSEQEQSFLKHSIAFAFIDAFRTSMFISASLALASAFVAWFTLRTPKAVPEKLDAPMETGIQEESTYEYSLSSEGKKYSREKSR
jgi:EmrB/QacA subfamily drug resistance transporter